MVNNCVSFTNREGRTVDGDLVARELGILEVKLINDFAAVGYGLLTLDKDTETVCLQKGNYIEGAPIACVGR